MGHARRRDECVFSALRNGVVAFTGFAPVAGNVGDVAFDVASTGAVIAAQFDAITGEARWVHALTLGPNAAARLGLGGIDEEGRPYALLPTSSTIEIDGELLIDVDGDVPRAVIIAFDEGGARWTFVDESGRAGGSALFGLVQAPNGRVVACGSNGMTRHPRTYVGEESDADQRSESWIVEIDVDNGALLQDRVFPGPDGCGQLVTSGETLWMLDYMLPRAQPAWGELFVEPTLNRIGENLVQLAGSVPSHALAFAGESADFNVIAANTNLVATVSGSDAPRWLVDDGAITVVDEPGIQALLFRRIPVALDLLTPASAPFGVAGPGFDAANQTALLEDDSVVLAGRFEAGALAHGGLVLPTLPDANHGFLVRFDPTGAAQWALTLGARQALVDRFPIDALAVTQDAIYVAGNVGVGGGAFAIDSVDERAIDGAFVARVDAATGAVAWLSAIDGALTTLGVVVQGNEIALLHTRRLASPANSFVAAFETTLSILDAGSGALAVARDRVVGASLFGSLAAIEDIAFTTAGGHVEARRLSDGALVWAAETSLTVVAVGVSGDDVVLCTREGTLRRLTRSTGAFVRDVLRPSECSALAVDVDGRMILSEVTRGSPDDARVVGLDVAGIELFARSFGGRGHERALAVSTRAGRIAVTGDFRGRVRLDSGDDVRPVRGDALVLVIDP